MAAKTIGILGGTFDPIHFGHLNLAVEILEKWPLDEVWFCPAQCNPFKEKEGEEAKHRLKMVNLALMPFPKFRAIDIELNRDGPSYTIDTLKQLIEKEKLAPERSQFVLLMGGDAAMSFPKWRNAEEIVSLVPLAVGLRLGEISHFKEDNTSIAQAIKKGCFPTNQMDISATEIRERLKKRLPCAHLVPKEVLDYIKTFCLY